jgi:hypothetical protein
MRAMLMAVLDVISHGVILFGQRSYSFLSVAWIAYSCRHYHLDRFNESRHLPFAMIYKTALTGPSRPVFNTERRRFQQIVQATVMLLV